MKFRQRYLVTVIRRSCLTDKVVWIYQGMSKGSAREKYQRACKREVERVKKWKEKMEKRRANIQNFLADVQADLPINEEMTPEQVEATRTLQAIGKKDVECDMDFYNHIMEERRRRKKKAKSKKKKTD